MSNSSPLRRRPAPLSIRLSESERRTLETRAGGLPVSTYVKHVIFAQGAPAFRRRPRTVSVDQELAGRLLAALGASRMASNLSQIAKHANLGNLFFDEETKADIRQACDNIREMRTLLMGALGKEEGKDRPESASHAFERAAVPRGTRR